MNDLPDSNIKIDETNDSTEVKSETTMYAHKVLFLQDYCTRLKGEDCKRCVMACPKEAITIGKNNAPHIDEDMCTGCGICFGICDAFSSNRVTLIDLHKRIKRIARQGDTVYFTCPEYLFPGFEPASNVIVLPCIACLPPEFWTLVLAENITLRLAFDIRDCAECSRAGEIAEMLYGHAISTAEEWTEKKVLLSKNLPEKENILKDITDPQGVDRRSAFTNLLGDVGDIASGKRRLRNSEVLHQFIERREKSRAIAQLNLREVDEPNNFAPGGLVRKLLFPKRKMLIEAIECDSSIAQRIPLYLAEITCTDIAYNPTFNCPTGALYPDSDTGKVHIEKIFCIGCGLCIDAYPEGAIDLTQTTAADLNVAAKQDTPSNPIEEKNETAGSAE